MLHTILTSKTSHNDQKPLHKQHHLISYCLVHKSDLSGHRQSIIISGGEWRKCQSVISWNRANIISRCRFRQLTTALFGKITLRYQCYKYYGVCSSTTFPPNLPSLVCRTIILGPRILTNLAPEVRVRGLFKWDRLDIYNWGSFACNTANVNYRSRWLSSANGHDAGWAVVSACVENDVYQRLTALSRL